jgi:hypothetical protein
MPDESTRSTGYSKRIRSSSDKLTQGVEAKAALEDVSVEAVSILERKAEKTSSRAILARASVSSCSADSPDTKCLIQEIIALHCVH